MNQSPRYFPSPSILVRGALLALAVVAAASMLFAGQASASAGASAGAYRVLLAEVDAEGTNRLQAQLATFPDVVGVDRIDTGAVTPSAAELKAYDVVVSSGDSSYENPEAWGNSLAGYVDAGGIVIQSAYDTWSGGGAPGGRWEEGGYPAFVPGPNLNQSTTLGSLDTSSPLLRNIAPGSLSTGEYNTVNEPSPGASVIARWADGRPAIAVKGRAIGVSAYMGSKYDSPGELAWTGNYGQLVVNAARALTPQPLTVVSSDPAGGVVTSTVGGIDCGVVCAANFTYGTTVGLTASASKGFAFAGFAGACAGTACALTMDGPKSVSASFISYKFGKVKLNKKKGTAKLIVKVGGAGRLVAAGKKVKKRSKTAQKAGNVTIPIVPKGKALAALENAGRVKVKVKATFTPIGGVPSTQTRKIGLKLTG